ncbi:MAG: hypothetical protein N0C84_03350 [Candidatus Thiodiazotropha taylori]|uniref:Secreted protein n=1 Tax=Candidatus Thiodiazotropha taylori TaxID=2792791 RepID=A0A9E4KB67_9GAMM|nr:hypothetical protein [Candidatus Thiodiazotropha taylori]MCW4255484.1 hypothetical protein [Candidatus Thiodiazotropha taylori]
MYKTFLVLIAGTLIVSVASASKLAEKHRERLELVDAAFEAGQCNTYFQFVNFKSERVEDGDYEEIFDFADYLADFNGYSRDRYIERCKNAQKILDVLKPYMLDNK